MKSRYRWVTPADWLIDHAQQCAENNNLTDLLHLIRELAWKASSDDIQDLFQDQMHADGYFDEVAG
ncbi:MAG: hypothetical protein C5B60_05565 [Chloroflexi bacterium]|jgi:hypothetical protein|nr:MAG: hypothetical protein C5B60_05565 [Chloroflexota bacterium]